MQTMNEFLWHPIVCIDAPSHFQPRWKQVSYYYDPEIGNFYYGHGHPMKPHRVRMAHDLIVRYGLHRHMEVWELRLGPIAVTFFWTTWVDACDHELQMLRPVHMSEETMQAFHSKEYIGERHWWITAVGIDPGDLEDIYLPVPLTDFLKNVTPENQERYSKEVKNFSFVNDCPVFERIFDYCQVGSSRVVSSESKQGCY